MGRPFSASSAGRFRIDKRQMLWLLVVMVASYAIIPQISAFHDSLALFTHITPKDTTLALMFAVATYFAAAGTYCLLAFVTLPYWRTLLIQIAGMFVNRLLPAGVGGIGVNYAYLRSRRHNNVQAATVVTANNALGIIGHVCLLGLVLLTSRASLPALHWHLKLIPWIVAGVVILVLLIVWVFIFRPSQNQVRASASRFFAQLSSLRKRPGHLLAALLCSMSLTFCNAFCFWLCISAVGDHISFVTAFLVLSFGVALGTATPTPGGLGGIEAGLVAGLLAYHVNSDTALAAVLLFRLITYWLPLAIGACAFAIGHRRLFAS